MGRALRVLMALTGLTVLAVYAAAAYGTYRLLLWVWSRRPDPLLTAAVVVALAVAFGYASHRAGTARVLRALDARELPRSRAPRLYDRFDRLTDGMDVGEPGLLVARMAEPNALALGGANGVVVLDAALFRLLTMDELEALLAHELAHLESNDGLVQTLGYSLIQTAMGLLFVAVLPLALLVLGADRAAAWLRGDPLTSRGATAWLRQLLGAGVSVLLLAFLLVLRAHSRRREVAADDRAVAVTDDPRALASALATIERASQPRRGLLSPLVVHGDEEGPVTRLLASHPPMADRIERLRERAGAARIPLR